MWCKKTVLTPIFLLGLAFSVSASRAAVLLPSHSSAGEPISVDNASALMQQLIGIEGQGDVWKLWARKVAGEGGQKHLYGGIAFRPFASSAGLCRSYVVEIETPSPWVYGHDLSAGHGKDSYRVGSELRMAIRQHGDKCSNIEFSKYFRVDREVTDQQATQLLGYIGAVLKDWKAHKSATKKSSTINLDQLRRIDLSEKNGESMVEFAFEVDGTGVQVFDVELPVVGKPHYSTTLEIP